MIDFGAMSIKDVAFFFDMDVRDTFLNVDNESFTDFEKRFYAAKHDFVTGVFPDLYSKEKLASCFACDHCECNAINRYNIDEVTKRISADKGLFDLVVRYVSLQASFNKIDDAIKLGFDYLTDEQKAIVVKKQSGFLDYVAKLVNSYCSFGEIMGAFDEFEKTFTAKR